MNHKMINSIVLVVMSISFSFQSQAAQMFFIDIEKQGIYRANLDGSHLRRVMPINVTYEWLPIEVNTAQQRIYWAERNPIPRIMSANYDGTDIQIIADTNLTRVLDLEFRSDQQKLYWTDQLSYSVYRSDPNGDNRETVLTLHDEQRLSHLAFDTQNNFMFMTVFNNNRVYKTNLNNDDYYEIVNYGGGDVWDIEYDPVTDSLYIHDEDNGELHHAWEIDGDYLTEELVNENWHPHGAEIDSENGRIYYANNKGRLIGDPYIAQIESRKLDGTDPQIHIAGLKDITGMAIDFTIIPEPGTAIFLFTSFTLLARRPRQSR